MAVWLVLPGEQEELAGEFDDEDGLGKIKALEAAMNRALKLGLHPGGRPTNRFDGCHLWRGDNLVGSVQIRRAKAAPLRLDQRVWSGFLE